MDSAQAYGTILTPPSSKPRFGFAPAPQLVSSMSGPILLPRTFFTVDLGDAVYVVTFGTEDQKKLPLSMHRSIATNNRLKIRGFHSFVRRKNCRLATRLPCAKLRSQFSKAIRANKELMTPQNSVLIANVVRQILRGMVALNAKGVPKDRPEINAEFLRVLANYLCDVLD
jgi:hypothetical protein